jgi:hypothetical protein
MAIIMTVKYTCETHLLHILMVRPDRNIAVLVPVTVNGAGTSTCLAHGCNVQMNLDIGKRSMETSQTG